MANPSYIEPIPVLQIRPGAVLLYDMRMYYGTRSESLNSKILSQVDNPNFYSGKMTNFAKSKLRFAVNLLVAQARWKWAANEKTNRKYRFKITFTTLTLPSPQGTVSDKDLKKLALAPWLRIMKSDFDLRSYVWRAERQKNGNLHFHVTSDCFLPHSDVRNNWNNQMAKFHFIDEFEAKFGHRNPNSTDIHSVINIRNLASYLVKYMSKDDDSAQTVDGKLWDCSDNLKLKERVIFEMSGSDFFTLDKLHDKMPERFKKMDQCTVINISETELFNWFGREKFLSYKKWLDSVYHAGAGSVHS